MKNSNLLSISFLTLTIYLINGCPWTYTKCTNSSCNIRHESMKVPIQIPSNFESTVNTKNITTVSVEAGSSVFTEDFDICELFPNLKEFEISRSGRMEYLDENLFKKCVQLQKISLTSSSIQDIKTNIFKTNILLKELSLENNEIKFLEHWIFSTLKNLKTLNLSHNQLVIIDPDLLRNLKLEKLDLSNNNLIDLEVE